MRTLTKALVNNHFLFFAWLLTLAFLSYFHTPWRDEFQSYLVSTRTNSWTSFFEAVRYERHPPLHYLLQTFFHSLGLFRNPKMEILIVTLPFTIGIGYLINYIFNLSWIVKLGILFSPYLIREHGIISRTYPIGGFFFLLAAHCRRHGQNIPYLICVVLASSTHLIFTVAGGAWLCIEVIKGKIPKRFGLTGIILITGLILYQTPPADSAFPTSAEIRFRSLISTIYYFSQTVLQFELKFPFAWNSFQAEGSFLFISFVLFGIYLIRKSKREGILLYFMGMVFPMIYIITNSYHVSSRYLGSFFWIILGILVSYKKESKFRTELSVSSVFAVLSFVIWVASWQPGKSPQFNFSDSVNLIQSFPLYKNDLVIAENEAILFPVMAWTQVDIFHVPRNKFIRYPYFRSAEALLAPKEWCQDAFSEVLSEHMNSRIVWVASKSFSIPQECLSKAKFILVYESKIPTVLDEEYKVYLISR